MNDAEHPRLLYSLLSVCCQFVNAALNAQVRQAPTPLLSLLLIVLLVVVRLMTWLPLLQLNPDPTSCDGLTEQDTCLAAK